MEAVGMLGPEWRWWNYLGVFSGLAFLVWVFWPKLTAPFDLPELGVKRWIREWWLSEIAERRSAGRGKYYENSLGEKVWNLVGVILKWILFIPALAFVLISAVVLFWAGMAALGARLFGTS